MIQLVESSSDAGLRADVDRSSGAAPARDPSPPPIEGAGVFSGSPESVVAAALLALEDAEQRQEAQRSHAFEERLAQGLAAIEDRRRENRLTLTAGILNGVADIAKGAYELVGAASSGGGDAGTGATGKTAGAGNAEAVFRSGVSLQTLQGAAKVASAGVAFLATNAKLDADRHDLQAEAFQEAAKQATRARDDADQSAERMLDGMRELGRLRHEAALAALRG